jgi:RNA polymerase sigma factor (sigma-70 family)
VDPSTDRALLERFVADRDEAAFSQLVARHGPLVLGVCRRVLGNAQDAEDAFQATFIVLSRKASSVRHLDSLTGWLHGVAVRTALKARAIAGQVRARERKAAGLAPAAAPAPTEAAAPLRPVLDEALGELPDKYRAPLVLCYLEGKTNERAARELGWPVGTMSRRLEKARDLLRSRLAGRGVAVTGSALLVLLAERSAFAAAVPSALAASTANIVVLSAAGEAAVSAPVALLVKGALKGLLAAQMKVAAAAVLSVGLLGSAAGVASYRALRPDLLEEASYSSSDVGRLDRRLDELQPLASERRVDRIGWAPDLVTARRLSTQHGRPVFLVRQDGDLGTGRCDGGALHLRAGLLNDDRVISILNRAFVPVLVANEDVAPGGRASPAEREELTRIYHASLQAKLPAGDEGVTLVAPDGKVLSCLAVPAAGEAAAVLPLLERAAGPSGDPVVPPGPLSRPPARAPGDLVLHVVARYVEPDGSLEKVRHTYHEFPGEHWLVLGPAEAARLLPREEPRLGLEWTPAAEVASRILTHFYPVTSDLLRDDSARSKVERISLRARLVSIRGDSMRARLEGEVRLSRLFYANPHPGHAPMPVDAKVSGFLDFEASGRIVSLKLTTDRATYGPSPFAVALRSR